MQVNFKVMTSLSEPFFNGSLNGVKQQVKYIKPTSYYSKPKKTIKASKKMNFKNMTWINALLPFRAILMTAFSFILGVIPLVIAVSTGTGSRRSLGTAVFGGMVAAAIFVPILVSMFFSVIQKTREKTEGD